MMRFFRFLLFFLFISLNAAPKMLVFHGENLPPFFCDPDSDSPGFAIELLKEVYPENEYRMSGNRIEVRTLNLEGDFASIKEQLDGIAGKYFGISAA